MRSPFFWLALGFTLGILAYRGLGQPCLPWCLKGFLLCLPLLWSARGKKYFLPVIFLAFIFLGVFYSYSDSYRPAHAIEKSIPQPFPSATNKSGYWAKLEGLVKTQAEIKRKGKKTTASFVLASRQLDFKRGRERKIIPVWGDVQIFLHYPQEVPEFGDRIVLFGKIQIPKTPLNLGQFDYKRYLASQHIYGIFEGYGPRAVTQLQKSRSASLLRAVFRFRDQMALQIDRLFGKGDAPLFKALILGMRKEVDPGLNEAFLKTGTSHLLAISGLNIAMVAGSVYLCLIALGIRQKPAAALSLLLSIFQVLIAGFGIPIQRAGFMAAFGFSALILERERNSLNIFFLAFLILVIMDTASLDSISFQLSFLSVLSLILFLKSFSRAGEEYRSVENLANGLAVLLGTFPIVLYHFNIFSPIGLLTNLGAIPLFHLALLVSLLALILGWIPFAGALVIQFAKGCLALGLAWIQFCAQIPWGHFFLLRPSLYQIIGYYGFLTLFSLLRHYDRKPLRLVRSAAAGLWLLTVFSFFKPAPAAGFEFTLLSAGKNELAHLEFPGGVHWLINAGRIFPSNQAEWILNPYLRWKGINHLAGILISDTYKKHWGGLRTLLGHFKTSRLLYPPGLASQIRIETAKRKVKTRAFDSLEKIKIQDGGELRLLNGVNGGAGKRPAAILKVVYRNWNFLWLPGVNEEVLSRLAGNRDFLSPVDILILPSQPMDSRTCERLFDLIDPDLATLPYPDPGLKDFLRSRDIPLYDLEHYGAITFNVSKRPERNSLSVQSFLQGRLAEISG